jgi:hypothetical protein
MLLFKDIQQARELIPAHYSPLGTVYVSPGTRLPIYAVRHFDKELLPDMVPAYAGLIRAVGEWVEARPTVKRWVDVRQPIEVGGDYVMRHWERYYYSLRSYDRPDKVSPVPVPDELPIMREVVEAALQEPMREQEMIIADVIRRSLLGPSGKTMIEDDDGPFIIVEPKLIVDDVLHWAEVSNTTSNLD